MGNLFGGRYVQRVSGVALYFCILIWLIVILLDTTQMEKGARSSSHFRNEVGRQANASFKEVFIEAEIEPS